MTTPSRLSQLAIIIALATYWPTISFADDLDALSLADSAPTEVVKAKEWRLFTEGMLGNINQRNDQGDIQQGRISFDLYLDHYFNADVHAVFSDRLDLDWVGAQNSQINTFREGYLGWQATPNLIADLGRINQRNGMAMGYNPTDYFKVGAIRSVVSIAPSSLRENRLGSGMVRGLYLWNTGSVTAIYSPKLGDHSQNAPFAPDFGTSNPINRWQVALSQQITSGLAPQLLLYGQEGQPVQIGLNASALINDALTVYGEYNGGRSTSLAAQAWNESGAERQYYSRLATGATYTFPANISLTLEYQYNGAALNQSAWQALASQTQAYWRYRSYVFNVQDIPTQHGIFAYASWNDAIWSHFDLTGMFKHDLVDQSHQYWLEARYHFKQVDLALQYLYQTGSAGSQFGALPQQANLQALIKYYF
ncbi:hypothetical protein HQ393_07250 [Chitinibacter bivalviorum]|uniref:Porin n=1 Tax=Chitinibacter bivalviorum TaxID=2739434 RepID=A0A7H9BIL8_9NEIS|nr:hypothetical protein [Chitinibacter bivalviorum]QLG88068.1 hypothetical protein HQ393_07250 [Chitinibacter bivalviorum]